MSDDAVKEEKLSGKKEALSNALNGEKPAPKSEKKAFIPTKVNFAIKEIVDAILIVGGEAVKKEMDDIAGITFKEVKPEAGIGFSDISEADIESALTEHENKAEFFKKLKAFRERYAGMSKDEIKAELEFGEKVLGYFDK